jgi:hypothetical protein
MAARSELEVTSLLVYNSPAWKGGAIYSWSVTLMTDRRSPVLVYCASRVEPAHVGMDTFPSSAHLNAHSCEMPYTRFHNGGGFG